MDLDSIIVFLSDESINLIMSVISLIMSITTLFLSLLGLRKSSIPQIINDMIKKSKSNISKEKTITMVYYAHLQTKASKVKLILTLAFTFVFPYSIYTQKLEVLISSIVLLFIYFLIITHENIVKYRIINGYFGNNYSEAKALICFIINNSDDIDFDDGNGFSRKKLFFPERKPNSLLPNILGEQI